ncbi:MAG: Gfo/Idh/MocA family oxidoreductase [Bacillota bacterium]|nr:Gfo/Idh/MocA family oxidoreductase [Bacillota bacterium]
MKPVRIALIGCGGIGMSAHVPAMLRLPGAVKLVATADVRREAAERAASIFGADAYTDYRQAIERKDVDMVLLATPEFCHRVQTEAAAAAGKHVLSEKPMATTLQDADRMIEACKVAGVKLMVAHSRRFTTRYQEVRKAIDQGEVGVVRIVRENERRSRPVPGREGYWSPGHWTSDPNVAVGAILTNAIHETDLIRWFTGLRPSRIYAEHKVTQKGGVVPDFISFMVEFAGGALGQAEVSNCLPEGCPFFHQFEVYGTRGYIKSKDADQLGLVRFDEGAARFPDAYHTLLHFQDAYTLELSLFVQAVIEDLPVPLPAEEARAALLLALAAARSASTGRPVDVAAFERGYA